MKKVVIIVALVVLLAGIAYVQALFSSQDKSGSESAQLSEAAREDILKGYISEAEIPSIIDSVRSFYLDSLQSAFADSIKSLTSRETSPVPSDLKEKMATLESSNTDLNRRLKEANNEIKSIAKSKNEQVASLAETFYKFEVAALPTDLTDYERSVSIKEIKAKAKKYFNLSSQALSRIASKYK